MPKKTFPFLLVFIFLFSFNLASAGVVINEVKLYPTEERFIELYNNSDQDIDLSNWYIQRKTQGGNTFSSLVSSTNFENKKIGAKNYFLISRSGTNSDIVLSNLTITESNIIQIKNGGGEVVDKICFGEATECSYKVANPLEGQSVGRDQNGTISIGNPSPGDANYALDSGGNTGSSSGVSISSNIPIPDVKQKTTEVPKIKTNISTNKNNVFVGIPIEFKLSATGFNSETLTYGDYFINFGDGDSKEQKVSEGNKVSHIYFYEGEYNVTLSYYRNYFGEVDAEDEISIKVISPDIVISKVGDEKDFFVEIVNNGNYEADISNWIISGKTKNFYLPRKTILEAKSKMILSPKITQFTILDKDSLKLINSQNEIIFDISKEEITPIKNIISKGTRKEGKITTKEETISNVEKEDINKNDYSKTATAVKSLPESEKRSNLNYGIIGLLFVLGTSTSTAYFIRKHKRKAVLGMPGDDFEIIDE